MPGMRLFSFGLYYIIVLLVTLTVVYPQKAFGVFVSLFYRPLRRLLERLGGLGEKDVRRKTEEFRARLPLPVLFLLRLWAFPTLWVLRSLQGLLGIDRQAFERAKRHLEDLDHFIGLDRFD